MYTVYNYPQQNMLVASQENHPHFLSCIPYDAFKFNNRYSPLKKKKVKSFHKKIHSFSTFD